MKHGRGWARNTRAVGGEAAGEKDMIRAVCSDDKRLAV